MAVDAGPKATPLEAETATLDGGAPAVTSLSDVLPPAPAKLTAGAAPGATATTATRSPVTSIVAVTSACANGATTHANTPAKADGRPLQLVARLM